MKNALHLLGLDVARRSRLHDRDDGAEDFRGDAGRGGDQARQEAPEPGERQAAVVPDGAKNGVDGVTLGAVEEVSFGRAVGLHVAGHGLDGVPPSHLAADGGREDAAGSGDHDPQSLARDAVAAAAAIDMGAPDRAAGEAGDLADPGREAVAVMGVSRQGLRAGHEPAAGPAGVGDGDGGLHAEPVSRARAFSPGSIKRLAKSGDIPCVKVGRSLRFLTAEIEDWIELEEGRPNDECPGNQ